MKYVNIALRLKDVEYIICTLNNIHAGASNDNVYKSSAIKDVISLRDYSDSTADR